MKPMFNNLAEARLHYKDIVVFVAIRSFYNAKDKYCYPSYQTIAKHAGVGSRFVSESVRRLEAAGFIDIWKVGKGRVTHYYKFPEQDKYQRVPYDLLENKELTAYEKSMLLLIAEYCDADLVCLKPITEIADLTGLTYKTIHHQLKALILKGYIFEQQVEEARLKTIQTAFRLTDKIPLQLISRPGTKPAIPFQDLDDVDRVVIMATSMLRERAKKKWQTTV